MFILLSYSLALLRFVYKYYFNLERRKPKIYPTRIRGIETDSYKSVKKLCSNEIEPIIRMLRDNKLEESFKQSLRKYLVIMLIASLEHFFRSESKYLVDKNNLDITRLFSEEKSFSLGDLDRMMQKDGNLTKGNMVASNFSFGNIEEVNHVFSTLLQLDFLDYVRKLNDIDQTRYIFDGHPILFNYGRLIKAYQMRNEIVHELKDAKISNWGILSLWDNIMGIMDIASTIFLSVSDPRLRSALDDDYQRGIKREKLKKIYESYSLRILKFLNENGYTEVSKAVKLDNLFLDKIAVNHNDKTQKNNFDWVLRRMLRRKVVWIFDNKICLTPMGLKRTKRIPKKSAKLR
jgi:hypothetical protein